MLVIRETYPYYSTQIIFEQELKHERTEVADMSLGKRIREYRIKRGLTQMQLAARLQMTEANISSYERDKSAPPSDKLNQLSDILGVSSDYLLGRPTGRFEAAPAGEAGPRAASEGGLRTLENDFSDDEILTLAAHRIGHEGPLSSQELEQIKLAMRIALSKK